MTGVLTMLLGMAIGDGIGLTERASPTGTSEVVPDIVPVMRYRDGAWIGRIVTFNGWSWTIKALVARPSGHWSAPRSPQELPLSLQVDPILDQILLYVYVDETGLVQGLILIENQDEDFAEEIDNRWWAGVTDVRGPGLGPVTGAARARLLGFIYNDLFPSDINPILPSKRPRLSSPVVFADSTVKTKRLSKRALLSKMLSGHGYNKDTDLTFSEVASVFLANDHRNIRPWGWERLSSEYSHDPTILRFFSAQARYLPMGTVRLGVAAHHSFSESMGWDDFELNYGEALTSAQRRRFEARRQSAHAAPRWTAYLYRHQGKNTDHWRPFAFLGASDDGPFEALTDAGLFVAESELDAWLDDNADFTGEPRSTFEAYQLLDKPTPLVDLTPEFISWAKGAGEEW